MTISHRRWYDRERTFSMILGDSMTVQSEKDASDVNTIVRRFQRTGELPPNPRGLEPRYEDVTGLQTDLTSAYNKALADIESYHQMRAESAEENEINANEQNESEKNVKNQALTTQPDKQLEAEGKGA